MEIFRTFLLASAAAFTACAGAAVVKAPDGAAYFSGETKFFSADGRLPYGRAEAALKREISAGGALITETLTQAAPSPSMQPKVSVTEYKRRRKTLTYDLADKGGAFSGSVTFKDGELKAWTGTVRYKAGGKAGLSGAISAEGYSAERTLPGARPTLARDAFKAATEEEYTAAVNMLKPHRWAE